MSDEEKSADEFGLVYPFVVCESNGGPYDDQSFVAGWECAQVDAHLKQAAGRNAVGYGPSVRTANLPQIDLIAMHNGFEMDAHTPEEFGEPTEWSMVKFQSQARG